MYTPNLFTDSEILWKKEIANGYSIQPSIHKPNI